MSNEVERVFIGNGRYALDRQLGAGGAGIVYLAFDTILGRWVAVKKTSAGDDTVSREAKVMASFHHTNIVMLHDIIEEGDSIFFVMEFVQGQTLEELAQPMTEEAFREFAEGMPFYGLVAANRDDEGVRALLPRLTRRVVTYGLAEGADYRAVDAVPEGQGMRFGLQCRGKRLGVRV